MSDRERQAPGGFLDSLRRLGRRSAAPLAGRAPDRLLHAPLDLVPGVAGRGAALLASTYDFGGQTVRAADLGAGDGIPWQHREAGEYWFAELHGFAWLRDLRAADAERAPERGRAMVLDWLRQHRNVDRAGPWRPELVGQRLSSWLAHGAFLLRGADDDFARRFYRALDLHARRLAHAARGARAGLPEIIACKGLVQGGICLPEGERRAGHGLKLLEAALKRQVLKDGGHVERNPSAHLAAMRHLAELRETLDAAGRPAPPALSAGLTRLAPALRMFRHGDGRLALFNAGVEEERWLVDLALARAPAEGPVLLDATETGFRRIEGKRATLIADMGRPPAAGRWAHAGTFGFEISVGAERLVVNCGDWRGGDAAWRRALRATAAHSTLTVDDTNTAALRDDGGIAHGPTKVEVERHDRDGASWLDARHDGYLESLGLIHRRRLYAAAGGGDIRGEDTLMQVERRRKQGREFAVRFHLHPSVECAMTEDRDAALLRLPSGAVWRLRAAGAALGVNESVYAGDGATRRHASQVVLTGPVQEATTVKWALHPLKRTG